MPSSIGFRKGYNLSNSEFVLLVQSVIRTKNYFQDQGKTMRHCIYYLIPLILTLSCSAPKIEGVVINGITNKPVQGVFVSIPALNISDSTSTEGKYTLTGVPNGDLNLNFSKAGFVGIEEKVVFTKGNSEQFHSTKIFIELSESKIDSLGESIGKAEVERIRRGNTFGVTYKFEKYKVLNYNNNNKDASFTAIINIKGKTSGRSGSIFDDGSSFNLNKMFEVQLVNSGLKWEVKYISEGKRSYSDF